MRIKILMIGNNREQLLPDNLLLREKNFLVYHCDDTSNISGLIEEIVPDVIFINTADSEQDKQTYNATARLHTLPIIYTLLDDELYLVNRRTTTGREKRSLFTDNIIDAVKMALSSHKPANRKTPSKVALLQYPVKEYAKA